VSSYLYSLPPSAPRSYLSVSLTPKILRHISVFFSFPCFLSHFVLACISLAFLVSCVNLHLRVDMGFNNDKKKKLA